ncbi:hypothetical protein [Streptomyces eurythermus]|uniref:hypothetical protein n=2 Tax=Streptomyces eurythermus TaxID=42237 RepID=UPI000A79746A
MARNRETFSEVPYRAASLPVIGVFSWVSAVCSSGAARRTATTASALKHGGHFYLDVHRQGVADALSQALERVARPMETLGGNGR